MALKGIMLAIWVKIARDVQSCEASQLCECDDGNIGSVDRPCLRVATDIYVGRQGMSALRYVMAFRTTNNNGTCMHENVRMVLSRIDIIKYKQRMALPTLCGP